MRMRWRARQRAAGRASVLDLAAPFAGWGGFLKSLVGFVDVLGFMLRFFGVVQVAAIVVVIVGADERAVNGGDAEGKSNREVRPRGIAVAGDTHRGGVVV